MQPESAINYTDWVAKRIHPVTGQPICGAKLRGPNKYGEAVCTKQPVEGTARCRMHGGESPRGLASPHYKHGQRSKYAKVLGGQLLEHYEQALSNKDLLSLSNELALLDARIMEVLGTVDAGANARLWVQLQTATENFEAAREASDAQRVAYYMNSMIRLINRGVSESSKWMEVVGLIEQRRKLAESERRLRETMQNFATAEQMMLMVQQISVLVKDNVTDPDALRAISEGLIRLVGAGASPVTHTGD